MQYKPCHYSNISCGFSSFRFLYKFSKCPRSRKLPKLEDIVQAVKLEVKLCKYHLDHQNRHVITFKFIIIKFIYSDKATKVCEIFTLILSHEVPVKSKVKISQNLVAFSGYMNFKTIDIFQKSINF